VARVHGRQLVRNVHDEGMAGILARMARPTVGLSISVVTLLSCLACSAEEDAAPITCPACEADYTSCSSPEFHESSAFEVVGALPDGCRTRHGLAGTEGKIRCEPLALCSLDGASCKPATFAHGTLKHGPYSCY
jgi:hypothetical protein